VLSKLELSNGILQLSNKLILRRSDYIHFGRSDYVYASVSIDLRVKITSQLRKIDIEIEGNAYVGATIISQIQLLLTGTEVFTGWGT